MEWKSAIRQKIRPPRPSCGRTRTGTGKWIRTNCIRWGKSFDLPKWTGQDLSLRASRYRNHSRWRFKVNEVDGLRRTVSLLRPEAGPWRFERRRDVMDSRSSPLDSLTTLSRKCHHGNRTLPVPARAMWTSDAARSLPWATGFGRSDASKPLAADGKLYLQAGDSAYWNLLVTGLEKVKAIAGGKIALPPPK